MMSTLIQDIRYAIRTLFGSPGFTLVVLAVIALGIGANSALFSVVNSVILRPLPYGEPEQLVQLGREFPRGRSDATTIQHVAYWRENSRSFDDVAAYEGRGGGLNLVGEGQPEHLPSLRVSTNFFQVLKVDPQHGRHFALADSHDGAEKVAMISDGLWRRRFASDPAAVGKVIRVSGEQRTVIGVMQRGFDFINNADIWTPMSIVPSPDDRASVYYVVARLKQDVLLEAAQIDIDQVAEQLRADFPETMAENERAYVNPLLNQVIGNVRPALLMLGGAVGIVLLIACANVANLLLARATRRQRELALRAAIGAGRGRIIRQLITESAVLATAGGALGLAAAHGGLSLLIRFRPAELPRLDAVHVDARVLGFTLIVTLITVVLFGLPPAIRASRVDLNSALKDGGGGSVAQGGRARELLIISEVALAMILLIGATLMIKSFSRLTGLDPGFDHEQTLTMKMAFGGRADLTSQYFNDFSTRVKEQLEAMPGIEQAGTISTLPLEHGLMGTFQAPGAVGEQGAAPGRNQWRITTPGYFEAMGIPLLRGRDFNNLDSPDSEQVVIINRELGRQAFAEQDPLGQMLLVDGPDQPASRIVGVVGDIREVGLARPPAPTVFVPASQMPDGTIQFLAGLFPTCWVVKTQGQPMASADAIQKAILSIDPELPVSSVRGLECSSHGTDHGRVHRRSSFQHAVVDDLLRAGTAACNHRHLRSDVLLGGPADPGDRGADGAGCDTGCNVETDPVAGGTSDGHRCRVGTCRCVRFNPPDAEPAVRRQGNGSRDVCPCRCGRDPGGAQRVHDHCAAS